MPIIFICCTVMCLQRVNRCGGGGGRGGREGGENNYINA